MLMPRKPALLLHLLNQVLKSVSGQTLVPSNQLVVLPQYHLPTDREAWRVHWQAQGQPWRTEPEIDGKRQQELDLRRVIVPDIEQGIYPFKGMNLSRADIEWLLTTHDGGRGPVNWNDESQQRRLGVDVRGADLRRIDLSFLPLACMQGSLSWSQRNKATLEQRTMAASQMEGVNLNFTHLERAQLHDVHLEDAKLTRTFLEQANLRGAYLDRARLSFAHLKGAYLRGASLKSANLRDVFWEGARLNDVMLSDEKGVGPFVADAHWDDVNLAVVQWSQIHLLGDEYEARQKMSDGKRKDKIAQLDEYERATRANRQLAIVLQAQGLDEIAAGFAYQARVLQKRVFWLQIFQSRVKLRFRVQVSGAYLFSWFLFLLAGYGYRLGRSFLAYLLIISLFMTIYHLLDPHLAWNEAFVVSMTAFHGRGFSPSTFTPGDPLSFTSAAEAFVGLIIEVTFIATLTQRFFSR
jgi:uncharacterized protein YjbI with pentapeptide repeats